MHSKQENEKFFFLVNMEEPVCKQQNSSTAMPGTTRVH